MKYPIGIQSFEKIRDGGYVYVDKTNLVYRLVTEGTIYFLSRPRRFGKSLLLSTLACYFQGRRELFDGLAIAGMEKDWLEYPVFRVDFNSSNFKKAGELENTIESYLSTWERKYGKDPIEQTTGDRFRGVLRRAHEQTGRRVVVLIDEYDKPLLDVLDTDAPYVDRYGGSMLLEDWHREVLKAFYSTFKAADEHLRFVMLTGVTKFSQISIFSGFNQPNDISMTEQYETLCGVTQEELDSCFAEPIARLAEKMQCTVDEMRDELRRQYDGYHFSTRMTGIYNPFSLLNAFMKNEISDYWFSTASPSYLMRLMSHFREDISEMTSRYYDPSMFVDYKADVEQPLPMIYQSGYLTIKEYNRRLRTYLLDFPNNEVRRGFITMLASGYFKPEHGNVTSWLVEAVTGLDRGDADGFCRSLSAFLASIPYDAHGPLKDIKMTEKHFQYTFYLLLRLVGVYCLAIHCESRQSFGRVDCILELADHVYIFEFKLDGTAREALEQIERNGYARPYANDPRKVVLIGVNFSSETRTVEQWETV